MASTSAIASPFTSNVLAGWKPVHPHIRYPVTLGLYREGTNLALFIAPMNLKLLHSLVPMDDSAQALVVAGAQVLDDAFLLAPEQPRIIAWSHIPNLGNEVDIIHLPAGANTTHLDVLTPILAAPHLAVPEKLGSRVAIGLNDDCHATVITPNPDIIQAVLIGFMSAYAQSAMESAIQLPTIPPTLQARLLTPMAAGDWLELRFLPHKRYWMFEFAKQGNPDRSHRWIAPANSGYWRSGWSW